MAAERVGGLAGAFPHGAARGAACAESSSDPEAPGRSPASLPVIPDGDGAARNARAVAGPPLRRGARADAGRTRRTRSPLGACAQRFPRHRAGAVARAQDFAHARGRRGAGGGKRMRSARARARPRRAGRAGKRRREAALSGKNGRFR